MLSARATTLAHDEQGFSLVELMVAVAAGIVVMAALFTILQVTLLQTSRTMTKVSATQRARTALETIENELHSACIASQETPIQGGASGSQQSDDNNLVFVSQYGAALTPVPIEHKITFDSTSGTLKEYTYSVSGTNPSNWVFSSTPTSSAGKVLLTNVQASGTTAAFQYFAYEPYTDSNGNTDMMLMDGSSPVPGTAAVPNPDPLTTPLSVNDASQTAEIILTFKVGGDVASTEVGSNLNTNLSDTWATVTDSIVLRFVTTPNQLGSNATFGPCA
ncbi:MAG TPA: type II secretion system protein [Solirubrobacteraceae bacterium]|nr:type II secretion system protein [Solirubrobacteraceae bacterium]